MLLVLVSLVVFYVAATFWFLSLCRRSERVQRQEVSLSQQSKLIPFRRPARADAELSRMREEG
jgi:hypothetical protein